MSFHLSGMITVPANDLARGRKSLPEHRRLAPPEPGCIAFSDEEQAGDMFALKEAFVHEAAFRAHQARIRVAAWAEVSAGAVRDYQTWQDET